MEKDQKEALQVTKEIVVKFIEMQRVAPSNFAEVFPAVFDVVRKTLQEASDGTACNDSAARSEGNHDRA